MIRAVPTPAVSLQSDLPGSSQPGSSASSIPFARKLQKRIESSKNSLTRLESWIFSRYREESFLGWVARLILWACPSTKERFEKVERLEVQFSKLDLTRDALPSTSKLPSPTQSRGPSSASLSPLKSAVKQLSNKWKEALEGIKKSARSFNQLPDDLKSDREFVLLAVQQNGSLLQFVSLKFSSDREIVLAAIKQRVTALEFACPEFKGDREIISAAIKKNGCAIKHASAELKLDRELALAAVIQNSYALHYIDFKFRADKEIILACVRQNGMALHYANARLKADKQVVEAAVAQNSLAINCADISLRPNTKQCIKVFEEKSAESLNKKAAALPL